MRYSISGEFVKLGFGEISHGLFHPKREQHSSLCKGHRHGWNDPPFNPFISRRGGGRRKIPVYLSTDPSVRANLSEPNYLQTTIRRYERGERKNKTIPLKSITVIRFCTETTTRGSLGEENFTLDEIVKCSEFESVLMQLRFKNLKSSNELDFNLHQSDTVVIGQN